MVETLVPLRRDERPAIRPLLAKLPESRAASPSDSRRNPRMYAIANINGIQTRVAPEAILEVPRLDGEPGAKLTFDQLLMVCDGDKIAVGQPYVKGAVC